MSQADVLGELERSPLLLELSADDRRVLAGLGTVVTAEGGTRLIEEGEPLSGLWVLADGRANVELGGGAKRALVAVLESGSLLGEASYLSGRPATATVTTPGAARLVEISQARLRQACDQHPPFGLRLERLLARIWAERVARLVGGGAAVRLPPVDPSLLGSLRTLEIQPLEQEAIARYARFGERNPYLWRWCLRALELTTLPCVLEERRCEVRATKFLAAMALVILDDVADKGASPRELDEALALVGEGAAPDGPLALPSALRDELAWSWSALHERARSLPAHAVFADLLTFDWRMVFAANRHARLARDFPAVHNPTENLEYAPHGIAVLVFGTLDLMASPSLGPADLRAVRELVHAGQTLCELANMIATWRREIADRDFGSRIFTIGLARGAFTSEELGALAPAAIVDRIQSAGLEELLMAEWRSHRARAEAAAARIRGFDPAPLLAGYDSVFGMTLAARGSI